MKIEALNVCAVRSRGDLRFVCLHSMSTDDTQSPKKHVSFDGTSSPTKKKRPTDPPVLFTVNGRKTPLQMWLEKRAIPKYFHCFDCGAEFQLEQKYDKHLQVHQALDVCYQIQECEDMRLELEAIRVAKIKREEANELQRARKSSRESSTESDS
ncbi:hypothetical protein QR680_011668 [Steinernema hermaphroditum]|uniref:C2H2-type domain-containing protein n=1 Tax=Steinernema hermaphroditum TaxID=289476 RepID=A0AA39I124_9BILA|nr:hypothetical protein QR680_011668 [Steinernema hermaphroditum]